jgi:hypothetical protein
LVVAAAKDGAAVLAGVEGPPLDRRQGRAERLQRFGEQSQVRRLGIGHEVEVFGCSHVPVRSHRHAADHHETNFMFVQGREQ